MKVKTHEKALIYFSLKITISLKQDAYMIDLKEVGPKSTIGNLKVFLVPDLLQRSLIYDRPTQIDSLLCFFRSTHHYNK